MEVDPRRVRVQRGVEVLLRGVQCSDRLQQAAGAHQRMQPRRRFEFGERFERLVLPLIQPSESIVRPSRSRQRLDRFTKSLFGVRIAPQLYEGVGER
jgi:hypothetical protein